MPEKSPMTPSEPTDAAQARRANMLTLEIVFLGIVGLVVLAAFFEALTYKLVSSRTPFVIMAPLFVLIVIQARKLFVARHKADFAQRLVMALRGRMPDFNTTLGMTGWMVGLVAAITVLGHYAGLFLFSVWLMRMARESWTLTLIVCGVILGLIWGIFEIGFNIELYRGLLWRYFAGYRDF